MYFSKETLELAAALVAGAKAAGLRLTTAESCTGGLVAAAVTEVPGASDVFACGYVTYADEAKAEELGVAPSLIAAKGAVSEEVARAMAEGALGAAGAHLAVAVTGIAGPGGGSAEKPVGLVHLAAARAGRPALHERHVFAGTRAEVRAQAVAAALALACRALEDGEPRE